MAAPDSNLQLGDLATIEPPRCACGCGGAITIRRAHRWKGVPKFIHGHYVRVHPPGRKPELDEWVAEHQGRHFCACGCGTPIGIKKRHRRQGTPRYLRNHVPHPSPGEGPSHPAYLKDRSLLKTRGGNNFTCAARRKIAKRDAGKCVRCGHGHLLQFDHIVPVFMGGGPNAENGQLLCKLCHGLKSQYEQAVRDNEADANRLARCIDAFWVHTFEKR
jgi:hypothetical protein